MLEIIIAALVGIGAGVGGFTGYQQIKKTSSKDKIARELANAKNKASDIVLKAKDEAMKIENERRKEMQKTENRLADRVDDRHDNQQISNRMPQDRPPHNRDRRGRCQRETALFL